MLKKYFLFIEFHYEFNEISYLLYFLKFRNYAFQRFYIN